MELDLMEEIQYFPSSHISGTDGVRTNQQRIFYLTVFHNPPFHKEVTKYQ